MTTVCVPLTQGKVAIVDEEDYPLIAGYTWHATARNGGKNWYAEACFGTRAEHGRLLMHRLITDAPHGVEVDHRDGDGLNNTRLNLRLATSGQNKANKKPRPGRSPGYKGVTRRRGMRKFRARVKCNKREFYLGYYNTAEEAARAYDAKAKELFGPFARLNFPD